MFFWQSSNILCPYMYVLRKKNPKNTIVAKTRTSKTFHFGFIIQIKYEKKKCLKICRVLFVLICLLNDIVSF